MVATRTTPKRPRSPDRTAHGLSRIKVGLDARLARFFLQAARGILLIVSIFYPYWEITLHAPQYPRGLFIQAYRRQHGAGPERLRGRRPQPLHRHDQADRRRHDRTGDLGLAIPAVALLAMASFLVTGIWRTLLRLPVILYPVIFVVDLFAWLYYAGHSLDPHAPMSSSISDSRRRSSARARSASSTPKRTSRPASTWQRRRR